VPDASRWESFESPRTVPLLSSTLGNGDGQNGLVGDLVLVYLSLLRRCTPQEDIGSSRDPARTSDNEKTLVIKSHWRRGRLYALFHSFVYDDYWKLLLGNSRVLQSVVFFILDWIIKWNRALSEVRGASFVTNPPSYVSSLHQTEVDLMEFIRLGYDVLVSNLDELSPFHAALGGLGAIGASRLNQVIQNAPDSFLGIEEVFRTDMVKDLVQEIESIKFRAHGAN